MFDVQKIDVLEGQHQISWKTKHSNSVKPTCIFNGKESLSSNTECSSLQNFSSADTIRLGMEVGHCSTNINDTRDIYVNVLKAPAITLTIDGEPVTDGATKSYEEGAQLELRCGAEGGVPDEIRSYTWMIGDTILESNSATMSYTASRADNIHTNIINFNHNT